MKCPFCNVNTDSVFYNEHPIYYCIWDNFPVNRGHALVVPRKHIATWFEASHHEQIILLEGIEIAKNEIEKQYGPDGFNIGINIGEIAGQTIPHLHIHVIPRYKGDVPDPRGGVRYVIPGKANYLDIKEVRADYRVKESVTEMNNGIYGSERFPLLDVILRDLASADRVDMAIAFILETGLSRIEPYLIDVLERGGRVRILTGDYLDVTEPRALLRMLDIQSECVDLEKPVGKGAFFECRMFRTDEKLGFHPKAYLIGRKEGVDVAYIGSSNLTRSAMVRGIEWNYRLSDLSEPDAVNKIQQEFELLFTHPRSELLTQEWVNEYKDRRSIRKKQIEPIEVEKEREIPPPPPKPHQIQQEALDALEETRVVGNQAGLVVLATGMGKTWLAAFDSVDFKRVLFVAHREEILRQAMGTFRRIRPEASLGMYTGTEKLPESDVLFASIQTLGRARHLDRFADDTFDYVVVDEFHHAAASTYRRLIDHFEPKFLLGLTATPERTDGADLLSLCGENLVYRCDLVDGINQELLSPFQYFGVPDAVDFSNIPWRSGRFDPDALENAVSTLKRAENAYQQWQQFGGSRTLAFCVSQRHADFMANFFLDKGVRVASVHSGPTAASRTESLQKLEEGSLQVVFAVDMFNEGVDVPHIDTVIMLRPTESRILWLQQFGRGLRRADGKSHLRVIDYIGNHRTFLQAAMVLLAGGSDAPGELLRALERLENNELELPSGCNVTYTLEALNILKALAKPSRPVDDMTLWYRSFRERHGIRPTASEAWHAGYDPKSLRKHYGSWLGFVNSENDFSKNQSDAFLASRDFLEALEITQMTKSYKMLVLIAMHSHNSLPGKISIEDLAYGVKHFAQRSSLLADNVGVALNDRQSLIKLLEDNPIDAWIHGRGMGNKNYFSYQNNIFSSELNEDKQHAESLAQLIREIIDYRLAQYLERLQGETNFAPRIICKVSHSGDSPILFLPSRETTPGIPDGWYPVTANGKEYSAKFVKIAVNVMNSADNEINKLPEVLRGWFGENAGQPGQTNRVIFELEGSHYLLKPLIAETDGPHLWHEYMRADIPSLWNLSFSEARWNRGYVKMDKHIFLLVTLIKTGMQEAHQYEDKFLSPDIFQWVSQNQQAQDKPSGKILRDHEREGYVVHLFVRKRGKKPNGTAMEFTYCGDVSFIDWEGSKPITVRWKMRKPLPEHLHKPFGL